MNTRMIQLREIKMKKVICIAIAVITVLLAIPLPGDAGQPYYRGGPGIGPRAGPGLGYGPGWGHSWGPRWGSGYGPGWGAGWGPGWAWWGPRVYWGAPYLGVPFPYYATPPLVVQPVPPVVVQQSPPVYVQPAPQPEGSYYWYYCQSAQGYYPYVQQCPTGWTKVSPSPAQPYQ
jgi:hypothetical protein